MGIGGCEDTKFRPKLEAGIFQSSNDFVGFFSKDWEMYIILMFSLIPYYYRQKRELGSLQYLL
jgi:hypothetical protein